MKSPTGSASAGKTFELSIDTGGTFTDGFVRSPDRNALVKVDTTPHDPTIGFAECVTAAANAMDTPLDTFLRHSSVVHFSSTLATNVMVQRTGAKVGLIVSEGHLDPIYGRAEEAAALMAFLDPQGVLQVGEKVSAAGVIEKPIDSEQLEQLVRQLLEIGVHLIVVSLANAHINPANEQEARKIIERSYPKHYLGAIPLVLSTDVSIERDDFGRTALAVANAFLHPTLSTSLYRAEDRVRASGLGNPLQIVNTDGSSTRVAKTRAIDTLNSGPTAGVLGAALVATELAASHVVTFDVGGTTTDVAYIAGGVETREEVTDFGGVAIPHSSVDLWSFGLGGGSLIRVAEGGAISVGPKSAGAVPGPACFGLGGTEVTPTDVWLSLGYLEPGDFLGGRRRLDPEPAAAALQRLADQLGLSLVDASLAAKAAIRKTLDESLKSWSVTQPGFTQSAESDRWLFSYGGGGGLLCVDAAEALGISKVAVFPQSSVFSAFGGGLLPVAHRYDVVVRDVSDASHLSELKLYLLDRATRDLRAEGISPDEPVAFELGVETSDGVLRMQETLASVQDLRELEVVVDVQGNAQKTGRLSLAVSVARQPRLDVAFHGEVSESSRLVTLDSGEVQVPVVGGLGIPNAPGATGPCFLASPDTTIFVPEGWTVSFDAYGYGILERSA